MRQSKAFSLIELMVVIAIVAVLAAVAAPAYKSYIEKTKYHLAYKNIADIHKKSLVYYAAKGHPATSVAQIGLTPDNLLFPTNTTNIVPTQSDFAVPPYVALISINNTPATTGSCLRIDTSAYVPYIDQTYSDQDLSNGRFFIVGVSTFDVNGVLNTICMYYDAYPGPSPRAADFPCVNGQTNTPETQAYVDQITAWNAQCN